MYIGILYAARTCRKWLPCALLLFDENSYVMKALKLHKCIVILHINAGIH